jgi:hypothetical protein
MVKEIKAYDSWVEYSEFIGPGNTIVGRHALPSELNDLSAELYRAATEDTRFDRVNLPRQPVNPKVPALLDIVSCDREKLDQYKATHGLWYHWNATSEKGSADYTCHGQEIEIAWWHIEFETNPRVLRIEVRVKNPTLETFLAIDPEKRRKMRFQSTSGDHIDVRKVL